MLLQKLKVTNYDFDLLGMAADYVAAQNIARYKVVDQIFHEFEYVSGNHDEYIDISANPGWARSLKGAKGMVARHDD